MSFFGPSLPVSLGRHTGDERRRLVSPLRTADVLLPIAEKMPFQTNGVPALSRMQQSAPTFGPRLHD